MVTYNGNQAIGSPVLLNSGVEINSLSPTTLPSPQYIGTSKYTGTYIPLLFTCLLSVETKQSCLHFKAANGEIFRWKSLPGESEVLHTLDDHLEVKGSILLDNDQLMVACSDVNKMIGNVNWNMFVTKSYANLHVHILL